MNTAADGCRVVVWSAGDWFAKAGTRIELCLWGKARPGDQESNPAHPLLFHMLDVAAVVHELVTSVLPTRVMDSLLAPFGGPDDPQAVPRLAAAAALHDLGKASPPFQAKWDSAVSELRDRDFDINPPHDARDHGKLSAILASEVLENAGVEALAAYRIARAVAAHHGRFPSDSDLDRRPGPREIGRSSVWGRSRERITADVFQALGVEHPFVASIPALLMLSWVGQEGRS